MNPMSWWYIQVYFHDYEPGQLAPADLRGVCDQLLLTEIRPRLAHALEQKRIERYFFIRYGEDGYHLRLRLKGDPETLATTVQPYFEEGITDFFKKNSEALKVSPESTVESLRTQNRFRYATYEPEYSKYGGTVGMPFAEQHFEASSELCFQVLQAEQESKIARSQFVLELMDIMLSAYGAQGHEKAFILRGYTQYWLDIVTGQGRDSIWQAMEANFEKHKARLPLRFEGERPGSLEHSWRGRTDNNPFQFWRDHMTAHFETLKQLEKTGQLESPLGQHVNDNQALLSQVPTINDSPTIGLLIIPNYIHMMNNRLGLSPLQEVQLTHLIYRYFEDQLGTKIDSYPMILEPNLSVLRNPVEKTMV